MKIIQTALEGCLIIVPDVFNDSRGFFIETFQTKRYKEIAGIQQSFVQDNHSRSARGVLRGLHFQKTRPQGKLVRVSRGCVYDVAVDVNPQSATYGQYVGVELSEENHHQFYIPPGYAHGFCVLSDIADFQYKCTDYYYPEDEYGIIWNDPAINIDWPVKNPLISAKDNVYPTLNELFPQCKK